jgi:hypothetical protein
MLHGMKSEASLLLLVARPRQHQTVSARAMEVDEFCNARNTMQNPFCTCGIVSRHLLLPCKHDGFGTF